MSSCLRFDLQYRMDGSRAATRTAPLIELRAALTAERATVGPSGTPATLLRAPRIVSSTYMTPLRG